MDPTTIIALLSAAAQLTKSLMPLVQQTRGVMSAQDQAAIEAALAELQKASDELFDRTQVKLRSSP
jgi:hypothetical protein